jgi:hypothetical protein
MKAMLRAHVIRLALWRKVLDSSLIGHWARRDLSLSQIVLVEFWGESALLLLFDLGVKDDEAVIND